MHTSSSSRRYWLPFALLMGSLLLLLAACEQGPLSPDAPPAPPAAHGGRVLGLVEVTFSGIGTGAIHATARPVTPGLPGTLADGLHLAVSPVTGGNGSIQLTPVSTGSFTTGTRGTDGERYMYATFQVRNAQSDGTVYADARTNLTFLAVSTASTLGGTAISSMKRFDGTDAAVSIASQILPTGAVEQNRSGAMEARFPDVLQVFTEDEVSSTAFTPPTGVTSVFPYGFVVSSPSDASSRTLPANPSADQFDGAVTFAFKAPLQASATDDPFAVSALFLAVDDPATRLTQSLEERDASARTALETRADALGATALTLLPDGHAFLGTGDQRVVCSVRTAGTAASATATMDLPTGNRPWLVPGQFRPGPYLLPRTATLEAARCPDIASVDASSFVVHGLQSGGLSGTYTGAGSSMVSAPAGDFFPGEQVEVTLTTGLGGTAPLVARYRVAVSGGTGSFTSSSTLDVQGSPRSVAAGDLDGDGDVDLAVANRAADTVLILQNDGAGNFTNGDTVAVGDAPESVAAADLDGDGDLDLAVVTAGPNALTNSVSVYQNDGSGTFTTLGTAVVVGSTPFSVIAADLDGDGDMDLAVANQTSGTISTLENNGSGVFTDFGAAVAVGAGASAVTAADLDGDGDLDLASANATANTVSILQNDGSGGFTALGAAVDVGSGPAFVTAADLDGDGDLDLATANGGASSVSILQNDGTGTFTALGAAIAVGTDPETVAAADVDGDGDLDLVAANTGSNSVSVLANDGSGTFTSLGAVVPVAGGPVFVVAADLDGDGDLDLATANLNGAAVSILTNQ
jgi:hypothetical protein